MTNPSPGNSITLRVSAPSNFTVTSELAAAASAAGAAVTALDIVESQHDSIVVDITANTSDDEHAKRIADALEALVGDGVRRVWRERRADQGLAAQIIMHGQRLVEILVATLRPRRRKLDHR